MHMTRSEDVTSLLAAWRDGDTAAEAAVVPVIYQELRRIAEAHLARERREHTLQPTALVHEAFLRLRDQQRIEWRDRAHFFAVASNMMRRILVDHARAHRSVKRGSGRVRVPLDQIDDQVAAATPELLDLDAALDRLATFDPTKASIVELRFFGGMSERETAEVLGCSTRTVTRHWRMAKAWLLRELNRRGRAATP